MGIESYLILSVSIIIAIISIIMPFTHINRKFGVRTKWSIYNNQTWYYSNIIGSIILKVAFISSIIAAGVLSVLFSYFVYIYVIHKKP